VAVCTAPNIWPPYADRTIGDVGPRSNTGGHGPCYRGGVKAWGIAPVVLLAACATTQAPGTYEAVLPAAGDGGERHIRVTLRSNGEAALSSAFSQQPSRFLAQGTWKQDDRRITLDLNDGKPMVFQLAGDQLIAKDWDRSRWGEKGPGALFRVDR
jgi:hypothetical protein